jgi:DNA-binding MarR family transcriptional regulator
MKHNYRKLQILSAIDILNDDNNKCFSRNKDIARLIGGTQSRQNTTKALSRHLSWGYIKRKMGTRYDKNVKVQRQICFKLTDMGEKILNELENRYYKGKDLNLRVGHFPQDVDFSEEGEVLLKGYKEMKEQGLL